MARPKSELFLSSDDRQKLTAWAGRPKSTQRLALRSRIVLACADEPSNKAVAAALGVCDATVGTWRQRFVERRLDGLTDERRPGTPRTIRDDAVERVFTRTLEAKPADATHWSTRGMAKAAGLSRTAVSRIWRAFGLKPHLADTFKLSTVRGELQSATRSGYTCRRPTRRSCYAWTRGPGRRAWIAPSLCRR